MTTQLDAIYENGVFRPLQPIQLDEHRRVTLTIETEAGNNTAMADQVYFALPTDRWQAFCDALDAEPKNIPALRKLLIEPSIFDADRAD